MAQKEDKALIPGPSSELSTPSHRRSPVIARMTQELLARAESRDLSAARFRIGAYQLREPDYRQILTWAGELGLEPEAVLARLADSRKEPEDWEEWEPICFEVVDGAIRSVVWDLDALGLIPPQWRDGLVITTLAFIGNWPESSTALAPKLPRLQALWCSGIALSALDLSLVPELTRLGCAENQLTALALSPVPGVTQLDCSRNQLTALDLSPVPGLTVLNCSWNKLTALDLSSVPGLTELQCSGNKLIALDLSPVPGLTQLDCSVNYLIALDLSLVPELTRLGCAENQLTALALSPVPGVTQLDCSRNQLTALDLSPVPGLTQLDCSKNRLTTLDFSPVQGLTRLHCNQGVRIFNAPRGLTCAGTIVSVADERSPKDPADDDFVDDIPF